MEEDKEEKSKWEWVGDHCTSQLCCAYSESLLHLEKLLSVRSGKQGFITKEGATSAVCAYICKSVRGGGGWVQQLTVEMSLAPDLSDNL